MEKTKKRINEAKSKVDSFVADNLGVISIVGIGGLSLLMLAGINKAIKWGQNGDPDAVMYIVHDENGFSKLMSGKEYVRFMLENGYTSSDKIHWTKVKD